MKKLLAFLILGHFFIMSQARIFTELKVVNNVWIAEFSHDSSIRVNSLSFVLRNVNGEVVDSAKIKQTVVDSINKHNSLFLISADSLQHTLMINQKVYIYELLINDIISEDMGWNFYLTRDAESEIYVDSSILHAGNYKAADPINWDKKLGYRGKGRSSLGKPNKREDAFAYVKGQIYSQEGKVLSNAIIQISGEKIWDFSSGSDTITTDANGYFLLATWPNQMPRTFGIRFLNYSIKTEFARLYPRDTLYVGMNYANIYDLGVGFSQLTSAHHLHLSPNPANTTLQASYTLPSELIPAQTVLQIRTLQGEALQSIALDAAEGLVTINLPVSMSNGTYLCSVLSNGVVYRTERFVVKR